MSGHPDARRGYLAVFVSLLALTALTVWVAGQDLGWLNTPVALGIATLKGTLVVLFFMHVKGASRLTWLFAGAGFVWLVLLITFTLSDYLSRPWLPIYGN